MENNDPDAPKISPQQIDRMYPAAKSFDELATDDTERRLRQARRTPHLASLKITVVMTVLLGLLVLFGISVEPMWKSGQIGIFFSFAFGLLVSAIGWLSIRYVIRTFYECGRSLGVALLVYGVLLAVAIAAAWAIDTYIVHAGGVYTLLAIAAGIHFVIVWPFLGYVLRQESVDILK